MTPDAVAALAAIGRLDDRPRRLWRRDDRVHRLPLGWQLPPRVRERLRRCVTSDATSGVFIPQTAAEWTTFNASNGWANPNNLYLFQEASGSILDKIGTSDLAVSGAPTYAQAVTGWATKCLRWADGTSNQRAKSTAIANVGTTSVLALAYLRTPTTPAATRGFMTLGTGANNQKFTLTTTPRYRFDENNVAQATDTNAVPSTVQCFVLKHDHTNSVTRGYVTAAHTILSGTFSASTTGNEFCLGSVDNGTIATIAMDALYCAIWTGSNAEKTDQDIKSLMMQLAAGFWTPDWAVAYSQGVSETDSLSESVAAVKASSVAVSETDSLAEAVVAGLAASPAVSETDNLSETIAALLAATQGVSETDSLAESAAAVKAATQGVSETDSLSESSTVQLAASPALAETDATSESAAASTTTSGSVSETDALDESVAGSLGTSGAVSETDALAETAVAQLAAAPAVAEADATVESLAAGVAEDAELAEAAALAESASSQYDGHAAVAESQTFAEAVVAGRGVVQGLADSSALSDALAASLAASPSLAELLSSLESAASQTALHAGLVESEAVAEMLRALTAHEGELLGRLDRVNGLQGTLAAVNALRGSLASAHSLIGSLNAVGRLLGALAAQQSLEGKLVKK